MLLDLTSIVPPPEASDGWWLTKSDASKYESVSFIFVFFNIWALEGLPRKHKITNMERITIVARVLTLAIVGFVGYGWRFCLVFEYATMKSIK
ncbi:hypothetical protein LIER_17445 [Lithospermum erythrorhizon]|uniref:Uncharacterized protein n=1 Tax=Lithospermum erythrorhizon TaxID=34254 RepID=A0AAV3QEG3_LITER